MSFFERAKPGDPPAKRSPTPPPAWFGPPEGVIPAASNQRAELLKSDQFALIVDQFEVYPNGVHFRVMVHPRSWRQAVRNDDGSITYSTAVPKEDCHLDASLVGKDVMYYGLQLADGTKWNNIDRRSQPRPQDDATGPIIRSCGGGGQFTNHWIWPLPPPGTIAFFAKWPKERLKERTVEIDADELRALSSQATVIWTT